MYKKIYAAALAVALSVGFWASHAVAGPYWSNLVGYTIIHAGTITGYVDEDGTKDDHFRGCKHNRKLIIDKRYVVTCISYSYHYAYRPDVAVLSNGGRLKLIVDDEEFDVRQ